jgi:hypothetical protein
MGKSLHHNTFKAFNIKIKVFYLNSFRKIYLISHFILIGERLDVLRTLHCLSLHTSSIKRMYGLQLYL